MRINLIRPHRAMARFASASLLAILLAATADHALAFYNPESGRWLNRDPIDESGGANLYELAGNDGINAIDPLGLTLLIGGTAVTAGDKEYDKRAAEELTKEILSKMSASSEKFGFPCWADFDKNRDFRKRIIASMKFANQGGGMHYTSTDPTGKFEPGKGPGAPGAYWTVSPANTYSYISDGKKSSYDAINSFFTGPSYLECLTCSFAIALKADADVLGKTEFDKQFPALKINQTASSSGAGLFYWATDTKTIVPGDWVYFKNNANYLKEHKYGYWQGENAIYAGKTKFSGFGAPDKTVDDMRTELLNAYNAGLPAARQIKLSDIPAEPGSIQRPKIR